MFEKLHLQNSMGSKSGDIKPMGKAKTHKKHQLHSKSQYEKKN
jgi:hypothetical protein